MHFRVRTNATAYRLDVYRMGYYQGLGARKVATVQPQSAKAVASGKLKLPEEMRRS